ncbi:unnamed protein product [Symbiodinium pilosum]|uniref:Uncharacterized protein n=1 Tax=Symbiodinium pilosum TaxID=2952 RepID=A0A812W2X0_SYMPI|nr:unnamed protein product [Symbiodinium pilosum]
MEEAKAKNVCHQMEIWKQLIDTELKTAANWEGQWGFLKGGVSGDPRKGHSASMPTLPKDKAMEYFTGARVGKLDRSQVMSQRNLTPKERYSRQLITSHEVGWRSNLERFGVSPGPGLLGLGAPRVPGPPPMMPGLRPLGGLGHPLGPNAGTNVGSGAAPGLLGLPEGTFKDPNRSLDQMRAEVSRVEQICKQHAAEAKAYVGVVARLIKSSAALVGAIQATELPTNVQILKDQLGSLKIGDSVVFKVAENQLGIPQVSFARKLEALTQERQRLLEVEAPLPVPGTPESDAEYLGFVTSFQPELGFGLLSCAQTRQLYGQEVLIHRDQFIDLNVSDGVHFKVALNANRQPVARRVRKAGGGPEALPPQGRSERSRSRSVSISSPRRRSRSRRRDRRR